ncbi:MAG TPA: Rrf2 family transcriptional regulator, partial [Terriglobales bacterium]|nr:Rrf2 family transcriptional regulator [Terriglobales bacterium]
DFEVRYSYGRPMHITAQEEYGLRCLLRVAKHASEEPLRTQEVAATEGISLEYAAKLMRVLKNGGLVVSTRGSAGGYLLSRPADQISVWEALSVLGGPLYEEKFCESHTGSQPDCAHTTNCSVRALWRNINGILQSALSAITLADLRRDESSTVAWLARELETGSQRVPMAAASTGPARERLS